MASLRLALPDSLRPLVQGIVSRLDTKGLELISPAVPAREPQRQRWLRLWLERNKASGASGAEADAALQAASMRAILALLDHQADAALLDDDEAGVDDAWSLLEPRPARTCTSLWIAATPSDAGVLGWWPPASLDTVSPAAAQLQTAVAELAQLAQQPALAAVVSFRGGLDRDGAATARLAATLAARSPAAVLSLYSPLFYRDGVLQVAELIAAVRHHTGPALPVLCVPRLAHREFASALQAAGGYCAGPLLAGAEAPVARVEAGAPPAHAQATCAWLLRRAAGRG